MTRRVKYYSNGQKDPFLFTLFNGFNLSDHLGYGMGSIFLEENPFGSDGGLSKNGGRGWDGSH
jgi:hypothetical protein